MSAMFALLPATLSFLGEGIGKGRRALGEIQQKKTIAKE